MRRLAHDNLKRDTRIGYSDVPLTCALYPERQTAVSLSSTGSAALAWRNVKCVCVCVSGRKGLGSLTKLTASPAAVIPAKFWLGSGYPIPLPAPSNLGR